MFQDLTHEEISQVLPLLNALDTVNRELLTGGTEEIWAALSHPDLGVERLDPANKTRVCVRA